MAYRDENGVITIDEAAAQADIGREARAQAILEEVSRALGAISAEAESGFQGETAVAIAERSQELRGRVDRLVANLQDAQDYTRKVVVYYQKVDEKVRDIISSGQ